VFSLNKNPAFRPTYSELLSHPWILGWDDVEVDMAGWAAGAMERAQSLAAQGRMRSGSAGSGVNLMQGF
jgi:hypothetical protein